MHASLGSQTSLGTTQLKTNDREGSEQRKFGKNSSISDVHGLQQSKTIFGGVESETHYQEQYDSPFKST